MKGRGLQVIRAGCGKVQGCVIGVFALWLLCLAPLPAKAADWLVLLVDRSNSIDDTELRLQREAYIRLLTDEAIVQALQNTRVAIVEFDTRAEVVAGWSNALGAARSYSRMSPDGLRGQTAIGAALAQALALLVGKEGRRIIDVSGDGRENVDQRLLAKMRRRAAERSIVINGLAIEGEKEGDLRTYYDRNVATGFVLPVQEREDFYQALRSKLFLEIAESSPLGIQKAAVGNGAH